VPDREPDFYELISQWLPIWDESHLPYIPLNEIGRAPAREWIDGVEGDWSPAVAAAMASAAETTDDAMVRWISPATGSSSVTAASSSSNAALPTWWIGRGPIPAASSLDRFTASP